MPVTIARRTRSSFAVAAALALALSACSPSNGSDESPSDQSTPSGPNSSGASSSASSKAASPTSKSASPTPVAASSEGPAKNWPVPKMPENAKEKTPEGLKAFSEYYFDLMSYTIVTNDPDPMKKVTSRTCKPCAEGYIDAAALNAANDTWAMGGDFEARITRVQLNSKKSGIANFSYTQEKTTVFNSDGSVYGTLEATGEPILGSLTVAFESGWKVTDLTELDS